MQQVVSCSLYLAYSVYIPSAFCLVSSKMFLLLCTCINSRVLCPDVQDQGRNHLILLRPPKIYVVCIICPLDCDRVNAYENLGETTVPPISPMDTPLRTKEEVDVSICLLQRISRTKLQFLDVLTLTHCKNLVKYWCFNVEI